ncbi:S8 family peptidase [Cellulomonas oligotrophica]|uniref:Peptidase S8/S53 domain-containing protein n=1 Tax=Cellulomonas oligotrophica TaxID=931536 RepID=A0A7Y9JX37_9CELL|nr:S8 family serine peptidase [Cellulomonas oligotrophica]NYD85521.1 hypothetical protein [Cellulomonas oligotrophica]GIG31470.1 hypothetical protein Col01nite_06290 [Cellulomonas oligotrophica]
MTRYPRDTDALGRPFGDDYRRSPLHASTSTGGAVPVSAARLARTPAGRSDRRQRAAMLERMRTGWDATHSQRLDIAVNKHDADTLVVNGEILVRASSWPEVSEELEEAGFSRVPLGYPDLESRLVRVEASKGTPMRRVEQVVRDLREEGHALSVSYVTPLGARPVLKPTAGGILPTPVTFASYADELSAHGAGVTVAVIDTGIAAEVRTDGWLDAVARHPTGPDDNIDALDAAPPDGYLDLYAGHGTFVAGAVAQVAPAATIVAYRAVGPGGAGSELDVAATLVRAVRDGAQVVNLSLGTQTLFDEPSIALGAALEVVAEIEADRGWETVVVAAAGNFGDETPTWPAAFNRVVAVGALTAALTPTTWSSRGSWVDISTVGEGVLSTYVQGSQSPEFTDAPQTFGTDAFARWMGTSFAAPQVAGAVARAMTELGISGPAAVNALLAAGKPVAGFGRALQILPGA